MRHGALSCAAFARACDRAETVVDLAELLSVEASSSGISYVACLGHHRICARAPFDVLLQNYPPAWISRYRERSYSTRDPVVWFAGRSALPFRWSDHEFRHQIAADQRVILDDGATFGLRYGISAPIHGADGCRASVSLASPLGEIDLDVTHRMATLALYAHEAARKLLGADLATHKALLAPRERQCLVLVAVGMDDINIADRLSISPETVRKAIGRAKVKLGAMRRSHAVVTALQRREFTLDEISAHAISRARPRT